MRTHSPNPDAAEHCGIGWGGFNLEGDAASIGEVRRLIHAQDRLRWFEAAYRELLDAGCPCKVKRP